MEITNHSRSERRRSSSLADNKESQKSARLLGQNHSSTMLNKNSSTDRPKTAYSVSPGKCIHQKLPSREDLDRYSSGFKRWKMGAPGSSDTVISRQNTSKRMTVLERSKKGLNTGNSWFDNDRSISLVEEKTVDRFMSTPYYDTMIRCFPTFNMRAINVPKAHNSRSRDVTSHFANFSVSSQNAFKTSHLKEKYSEAVKVYPNKHPEFYPTDKDFNFKIDRMTNYVESMLKLKPLWDPNKLRQTKLTLKD